MMDKKTKIKYRSFFGVCRARSLHRCPNLPLPRNFLPFCPAERLDPSNVSWDLSGPSSWWTRPRIPPRGGKKKRCLSNLDWFFRMWRSCSSSPSSRYHCHCPRGTEVSQNEVPNRSIYS